MQPRFVVQSVAVYLCQCNFIEQLSPQASASIDDTRLMWLAAGSLDIKPVLVRLPPDGSTSGYEIFPHRLRGDVLLFVFLVLAVMLF